VVDRGVASDREVEGVGTRRHSVRAEVEDVAASGEPEQIAGVGVLRVIQRRRGVTLITFAGTEQTMGRIDIRQVTRYLTAWV
jgi:hypothetical protein